MSLLLHPREFALAGFMETCSGIAPCVVDAVREWRSAECNRHAVMHLHSLVQLQVPGGAGEMPMRLAALGSKAAAGCLVMCELQHVRRLRHTSRFFMRLSACEAGQQAALADTPCSVLQR